MIIPFSEIKEDQQFVGSKAYVLAILFSKGLPVPNGLILSHKPDNDEDWNRVRSWWTSIGMPLLAVRSSAFGEDSKEMSFAGQNQSFLNVKNFDELQIAVSKCFASVDRESSKSYRKFFTGSDKAVPMNVVLQEMVDAKYSGVYFSENPLNSSDAAMLEYIEGFGEALVSGQKNPFRVFENQIQSDTLIDQATLKAVFQLGHKVELALHEKVDMEWAIDQYNKLFMLQARPITASRSLSQNKKLIEKEFSRIEKNYSSDTCWDGQTFCEWTGNPSQLSFEVWKKAFASGGALDLALHELGYLGFNKKQELTHESILDQVFGRAFVNMSKMLPLYFGPIPYEFVATPRPQMKFTSKKITWEGILKTPLLVYRMFGVGWALTTKRRVWIDKARKELVEFRVKMQRPSQSEIYADWSTEKLVERWEKEINNFSKYSLKWPLVIAVLIEATFQSLQAIVKSALGKEHSEELLREWMGAGLSTATFEMNSSFKKAQNDPLKRDFFFSRYGHRGPGELDLSHPRWQELGETAFRGATQNNSKELEHTASKVETFILGLNTFKRNIILDEWRLLKELLELREQWKMEILKPYAHIRYITLELAKRYSLGQDVFSYKLEEIKDFIDKKLSKSDMDQLLKVRKANANAFRSVYLPDYLTAASLKEHLFEKVEHSNAYRGLSLSGGFVKGHVKIVSDPNEVDFSDWSDDTILVAPATDPGWTSLLTRVKGVVVERGGVLSHCAIVAREMNLPAINLAHATGLLKNGDAIYIDADQGKLFYEPTA